MASTAIERPEEGGKGTEVRQFLTFSVGSEEYGVDVQKVQEIKAYVPATRVPNSCADIVGVLNLRGIIVPVIDMRLKFGLDTAVPNKFTAIVVVVVEERIVGLMVDSVWEVTEIPQCDMQSAPDFGSTAANEMIQGMARVGEKLITLLDVDFLVRNEAAEADIAA